MRKADFAIIGIVLAIVGVLVFLLYFVNGESGKYVIVEADGRVIDTIALSTDYEKQYDIDGETNTLVIRDGRAQITQASCPDGICKNHMPISRAGESIICLPHRLVVSITDKEGEEPEIDAVA